MKQILDKVNEIAEVLNDTNGVTNVEWVKNNVNELQKAVKEICNLPVVRSRSFNELEYQAEQNECANMYLNDLGIPTEDALGEKYSTVGRIKYLEWLLIYE